MEFDQGFSLIFLGISAILIISLMVWYNWNEQKEYKLGREKIKTIRPDVEHIDNKIDIILLDLGKWINKCRKCNSSVNFIKNYSEKYINLSCEGCGKISTLHQFNDHKYQIDSIPEFYYSMTKMQSITSELRDRALPYIEDIYFSTGKSLIGKSEYNFLHSLKHSYYQDYKTQKKYGFHWNPQIRIFSDGEFIDKINSELKTKKIEKKLGKRRKELNQKIIDEWNYLKIKSGSKNKLIKEWAINSNAKCPDGLKCGSVSFKDLKISQIALGHIIPQDFAREMPHLQSQIHHPDNLYLTCNLCNSALGGNPPDNELKTRIFNTGTIGDWIRDKLTDID